MEVKTLRKTAWFAALLAACALTLAGWHFFSVRAPGPEAAESLARDNPGKAVLEAARKLRDTKSYGFKMVRTLSTEKASVSMAFGGSWAEGGKFLMTESVLGRTPEEGYAPVQAWAFSGDEMYALDPKTLKFAPLSDPGAKAANKNFARFFFLADAAGEVLALGKDLEQAAYEGVKEVEGTRYRAFSAPIDPKRTAPPEPGLVPRTVTVRFLVPEAGGPLAGVEVTADYKSPEGFLRDDALVTYGDLGVIVRVPGEGG